jgi:hypothetical protein
MDMDPLLKVLWFADSCSKQQNCVQNTKSAIPIYYVPIYWCSINARERSVNSPEDIVSLLIQAEKRRHVAPTRHNEVSSRSHTLLTIVIECMVPYSYSAGSRRSSDDQFCLTRIGRLAFVDLAGNERIEARAEYMAESNSINKSLFFLGKLIEKLAGCERTGRSEYLPVRDSNLTRLLAFYFGGNSRTGLLVTLTPSMDAVEESLSTLRFAQKASTIRCNAQPVFLSKDRKRQNISNSKTCFRRKHPGCILTHPQMHKLTNSTPDAPTDTTIHEFDAWCNHKCNKLWIRRLTHPTCKKQRILHLMQLVILVVLVVLVLFSISTSSI